MGVITVEFYESANEEKMKEIKLSATQQGRHHECGQHSSDRSLKHHN